MGRILLIEDDPFLSSLLKNRLTKEGFEIINARDGEEAMEFLKSDKVDLALLDIILPKKSGFEVLEEIRNNPQVQNSTIPIFIISNLGQPEDVSKGYKLGAIEYFIKAKTSIDDLIQKIKDFLVLAK
ncbi:response regulator [Candidatus Wolfebacteria bacterium]|nr:response regulator [Candidatus Wolfebacteria bacterium]